MNDGASFTKVEGTNGYWQWTPPNTAGTPRLLTKNDTASAYPSAYPWGDYALEGSVLIATNEWFVEENVPGAKLKQPKFQNLIKGKSFEVF